MRYETLRFHLRPVVDDDLPALFRNFSDPAMMKFYDLAPATNMDEVKDVVARWRRWERKGTGVRWAIALKGSGKLIGTCGFQDIDRRAGCAEFGCEVSREYWGRGVMPELAPAMGRHAFDVLGLSRVNALVAPGNRASIRLMQTFGFRKRRLLRGRMVINGKRVDMLSFTISRAAYRARMHPNLVTSIMALPAAVRETAARIVHYLGTVSLSRAR